eukprot:scaffold78483_cov26-Prasinocladus_malaysianus.AAC.3
MKILKRFNFFAGGGMEVEAGWSATQSSSGNCVPTDILYEVLLYLRDEMWRLPDFSESYFSRIAFGRCKDEVWLAFSLCINLQTIRFARFDPGSQSGGKMPKSLVERGGRLLARWNSHEQIQGPEVLTGCSTHESSF